MEPAVDLDELEANKVICVVDLESSSGWNRRVPGRLPDETTGDIIGLGAVWMTWDRKAKCPVMLDSCLAKMYVPQQDADGNVVVIFNDNYVEDACYNDDRTIFSRDCYENFWTKDKDAIKALPKLVVDDYESKTRAEVETSAVWQFVRKSEAWKRWAKERGYRYKHAGDCLGFDYGNLDQMISERLAKKGTMHIGGYNGSPLCVDTKEKTILGMVDNAWVRKKKTKDDPSTTERLHMLYGVPKMPFKHNHMPDSDARSIAWRFLVAEAIEDGEYTIDYDNVKEAEEEEEKRPSPKKKRKSPST